MTATRDGFLAVEVAKLSLKPGETPTPFQLYRSNTQGWVPR